MSASRWEIVHTGPHQFHARLVAPNNEVIVWTETYRTTRAAREAIDLVLLYAPVAMQRLRKVDERQAAPRIGTESYRGKG